MTRCTRTVATLIVFTRVAVAESTLPTTFDPSAHVPVDTSRLMGSPDPLPPLVVEKAFPHLVFTRPVAITNAADGTGRLFVCDQPGIIYVFPNDPTAREIGVFLDIRPRVKTQHFEEGLLGLAFHPRYRENGEFFVYYTIHSQDESSPSTSVLSRWRVSADHPERADPDSEEVLLRIPQPFGNHNGGSIEFGPDGYLYVGLGDGGARDDPNGNGQNLRTLLGSILRIDVDRRDGDRAYAIPPDNPFASAVEGIPDGARPEIFAYGVRNAWRITFDRLTGEGWFADVGQDLWEEVNRLERGANYGWKLREGLHPWKEDAPRTGDTFVEPVLEYPRDAGKSITGGVVYRGRELPELFGAYVYGDFVSFNLWAMRFDGAKATSSHLIARSSLPITAFGEDEDGEIYFTAFEAPGRDTTRLSTSDVFRLDRGGIYRFRRREDTTAATVGFPRLLSETGLFTDIAALSPHPGLVPYQVNAPLWSDGAGKERFIALPADARVGYRETGAWEFPVGTVLVKTFTLGDGGRGERRLETRLLVHSERGWDGYTYMWNDAQTDARLLDAAVTRAFEDATASTLSWYFPSRSDCNACHTQVAGFVLGVRTRQLNRIEDYGAFEANQLDVLEGLGVVDNAPETPAHALAAFPRWDDETASIEARARAYLDANCAFCHAPGGTGLSKADLRFETPLAEAFLIDQEPGQGRLGGPESRLVTPGHAASSELFLRLVRRGAGQMPTLASSRVDWEAVEVIGRWIEGLRR